MGVFSVEALAFQQDITDHSSMKPLFRALPLALIAAHLCSAAQPAHLTPAALLDEAIQRPGDFSQTCDAPDPVPYKAPPLPLYGLGVPQPFSLSDRMKAELKKNRDAIVKEIGVRLEKLDWTNPPPAPKLPKKALFPTKREDQGDMDPNSPSEQNPRTLGPVMLSLIVELNAKELLPQLLKLEEQLNTLNEAALQDPDKAPVAKVDAGGFAMWQGADQDFKDVEDWDKAPPKLKRKKQIFEGLVFDREILGVMLELVNQAGFEPLKKSEFAELRAKELKAKAETDEMLRAIKSADDLNQPDKKDLGIGFDKELGIPYWHWQHILAPYTSERRAAARKIIEDFVATQKA